MVFDERLLEQAHFLVELLHLARNHFLGDVRGLAAGNGLREIDFLLLGVGFRRHIFFSHVARIAGRNVHRDVVHQLLEIIRACHEIALAVHLDQHANLAAGVNVAPHRSFTGHARRLLRRHRDTLLAKNYDCLLHVSLGFGQSLLAIHHRGPSLLPEILHLCRRNIHCSSTHKSFPIRISSFE